MKELVQSGMGIFKCVIISSLFINYAHAFVRTHHSVLHPQIAKTNSLNSTFEQRVDQLYKSDLIEACDLKQKKNRYQLAKYLDQNHKIILKKYNTIPRIREKTERIDIGNLSVKVVKELPGTNQFITILDSSWKKLSNEFNKLQNLDLNGDLKNEQIIALYNVLMDFQYIMTNDSDRLEGVNMYLNKDSGKILSSMNDKIIKCMDIIKCKKISFSNDETLLIELYYLYKSRLTAFNMSGNKNDLMMLRSAIQIDLSIFRIEKNSSVTIKDGQLYLPLVLAPELVAGKEIFSSIVESIWFSSELKLNLMFDESNNDIFKVVFFNFSGQTRVNRVERAVKLHQDVRSRTIAHEIGHVLGLSDNYFKQWKPETCQYDYQYNPADIMSDVYGRVLPVHWSTLRALYEK